MASVVKHHLAEVNAAHPGAIVSLPNTPANQFHLITPTSDLVLDISFPADYPASPVQVLSVSSGTHENLDLAAVSTRLAEGYPETTLLQAIDHLAAGYDDDAVSYDHIELPQGLPTYTWTPADISPAVRKAWAVSTTALHDRKSAFVAFATRIASQADLAHKLQILHSDPRVAEATHTSSAHVFVSKTDNGVAQQHSGYDDDGETNAGVRMQHLLAAEDLQDVCVCVSRWWGGVLLGTKRFEHLDNVMRDALTAGGFLQK